MADSSIMIKKVPVLVIAFNRPEHARRAMGPIREYQPDRVYLACDGPRVGKEGELKQVDESREAMKAMIDWPCDVKTLFQSVNLGCAYGPYTAISWFFEHEEYGIIIEDDVIVGLDFFKLCEVLLPRYASEERIMQISAENHSGRIDVNNSYVYSQFYLCWGWATWRRAWRSMDMSMSAANNLSSYYLIKRLGLFRGLMMRYYFRKAYNHIESFSSWATRWYLSILAHDGLVICPGANLAINIGMSGGEHYQRFDNNPYKDLTIRNIEWPLVYNDILEADRLQKKYDSRDFLRIRMFGLKNKLKNGVRKS